MEYHLSKTHIDKALKLLAKKDVDIKAALNIVGFPEERRRGHGFPTLMRIIVGQQLSVKAAATIAGRVEDLLGGEMDAVKYMEKSDDELRGCGLSRPKVSYGRGLCEAVLTGTLDVDALPTMSDEEAQAAIVSLKGFGRWSAEMYLMFSLGRQDIWPADDLAVQEGVKRLKGLAERPGQKEMDKIAEQWRPHRAAVAIFLWHFYSNAPDI